MPKLNKKQKLILEITIVSTILILSFLYWNSLYIYPVKLFVVLLHELSHGIAALLSGGSIKEISFNENLGGYCEVKGGIPILIANAGYLGSLFWGSYFLLISKNDKYSKITSLVLSILLIIAALFFINPGFPFYATLIFASILFFSAQFLPADINSYFLKIIGLISCLYVIVDIRQDILTTSDGINDAVILKEITGLSEYLWGGLWLIVSLTVTFFVVRKMLSMKQRTN